jgi:hypothetical protein
MNEHLMGSNGIDTERLPISYNVILRSHLDAVLDRTRCPKETDQLQIIFPYKFFSY